MGTSGFHTAPTLVDALEEILLHVGPDHIATLDPTEFAHGSDHVDHVGAARFALAACQRYAARHSFAIHDSNFCRRALTPEECELHDWYPAHVGREYSESALQDITGPLRTYGARCLSSQATPELETCVANSKAQDVDRRDGPDDSKGIVVPPLFRALRERTPGGARALRRNQRTDLHVALRRARPGPASRCLEVEPTGDRLRLYDCLDEERQRFVLEAGTPRYRTPGSDFSDADLDADPAKARSFSLGDLDGDGFGDVCGRGREAIFCARSNGQTFIDVSRWGYDSNFSNAEGWDDHIAYYGSIRLADIDGDGRDDLCGRGRAGLWCAISQGTTGFDQMFRIQPHNFRDDQGWRQERFGPTIEWADLDRDGHADACGRAVNGLICATSP